MALPKADFDFDMEADNIMPATELIDMCMEAIGIMLQQKYLMPSLEQDKLEAIAEELAEQRKSHVGLQQHLEEEFDKRMIEMKEEELGNTDFPA